MTQNGSMYVMVNQQKLSNLENTDKDVKRKDSQIIWKIQVF